MFVVTFTQNGFKKQMELTSEQLDLLEALIDNDLIDVDCLKIIVKEWED